MIVLGASDLARLVPMEAAIDSLEDAFRGLGGNETPLRTHHSLGDADLLLMSSWGPAAAGVKVVTVNPANPPSGRPLINGIYVLLDRGSLAPRAIVDGAALTSLRTAAVSGLATRLLARPDATRLVIFGAGTQARGHLDAMTAVREIVSVTVVSRTPQRAEALASVAHEMGLEASVGTPDAVAEADIVCTCTTSHEALFDGGLVPDGAHVNAVGSYTPEAREVDDELVRRSRIVVETRGAALAEAGDLISPLRAGIISEADVTELAEALAEASVRRSEADLTLFKSVGQAFEDLAVAATAASAAGLQGPQT